MKNHITFDEKKGFETDVSIFFEWNNEYTASRNNITDIRLIPNPLDSKSIFIIKI